MTLKEYIINYNLYEGQNEEKTINIQDVDFYEEKEASELMDRYVEMLREKLHRKKLARDESTFVLSGTSEDERYIYDSMAGVYIYENQYERKEIQGEIAELTGLSRDQVELIALRSLGKIADATEEEKSEVAKMLAVNSKNPIREEEPNM